jgi:hypothetical protein
MTRPTARDAASREVLAYFGHHKCASTWIAGILQRVTDEVGLRYFAVHDALSPSAIGPLSEPAPGATHFEPAELRDRADAVRADLVVCHNADRVQAEILHPNRAFHVIRDPRDIIVSAYFSHRNSHPTDGRPQLQAHRAALRHASPAEGLLLEMAFSEPELLQIADWDYGTEAILELTMEELTLHPYDGFIRVFRHLGLLSDVEPIRAVDQTRVLLSRLLNRVSKRRRLSFLRRNCPATAEIVLGAVYSQRFEVQTKGRERGQEDMTSHYRKGIAGDWANYFTRQHAEAFDERFGDLLVRLGYETNSDWIVRARGSA